MTVLFCDSGRHHWYRVAQSHSERRVCCVKVGGAGAVRWSGYSHRLFNSCECPLYLDHKTLLIMCCKLWPPRYHPLVYYYYYEASPFFYRHINTKQVKQ